MITNQESSWEELIKFINKNRNGYKLSKKNENMVILSRQTSLQSDLEIESADGEDFMKIFSHEFNVDCLNFKFSDYFIDNVSFLLFFQQKKLEEWIKKERINKKNITLGMLEQAIIKGKWEF